MTIASWAAIFTAATVAAFVSLAWTDAGVGLDSFRWFLTLSVVASLVRSRAGEAGPRIAAFLAGLRLI